MTIRVYSGAEWSGDWHEHFQRALFFLHRLPPGIQVIGMYAVPARPTMQNVLAAFFLGLTADRFELFQAAFGFLNTLVLLPCVLLMPALGFGRRRRLIPLVALLAANPPSQRIFPELAYRSQGKFGLAAPTSDSLSESVFAVGLRPTRTS